jgi:hypothetical protein
MNRLLTPTLLLTSLLPVSATAAEWSGYVAGQYRGFLESPADPRQHDNDLSASAEPEFYHSWDDGDQSFDAIVFYRADQYDDNRSHGDIRELSWTGVFENFEVRAGISKVFWGVAETQHVVDIINQTDLVENVDGEDKLGQPMVRFSAARDWGTLDFYVLPGFRERTYPGAEGRPRPAFVIDTDRDAIYDFSAGKDHIDLALRYSHDIDDWSFGLSYFSGVGREPSAFQPVAFSSTGQPTIVVPVYSLINQAGIDGQAFFGEWTWKLEAISTEYRSGVRKGSHNFQSVSGFEYTIVGIADSRMDLGIVIEYHYSNRDKRETIFDNDLATALRFVLNDIQSTEVLFGVTTDIETHTVAGFIEASRRLGDSWTLEAQLRTFSGTEQGRPLYSYRFDNFVQIELARHF